MLALVLNRPSLFVMQHGERLRSSIGPRLRYDTNTPFSSALKDRCSDQVVFLGGYCKPASQQ